MTTRTNIRSQARGGEQRQVNSQHQWGHSRCRAVCVALAAVVLLIPSTLPVQALLTDAAAPWSLVDNGGPPANQNNWAPLPPGGVLGWLGRPGNWPITAEGSAGTDVSRDLFAVCGNVLRARQELIPIMFTKDPEIAISDCLFYAVQPIFATEL